MDGNIFPYMGSMYSYERDHKIKDFKCTKHRHANTVTKIERTRISLPLNIFEKISKRDANKKMISDNLMIERT
jgi:hypothetical protein